MTTLIDVYEEKIRSGLVPDADQRKAVDALHKLNRALAHYFPARKKRWNFLKNRPVVPKGMYLYGGVGRGKSMVMDLFFAAATVEKKRRVHFHAFMLEVHDFLHARRQTRALERQGGKGERVRIDGDLIAAADHIAAQATLLCFDEFQVRDVADAMILGRLFTALFDRGVVVVMTSNIAPDDLYAGGLQRDRFLPFIGLLKDKLEIFVFSGDIDYRLRRLRDGKMYFWPHDADTQAELDRIFDMIAEDVVSSPAVIEVKGRIICVPRAAREVAAFSFADLCEEPKSALDYLELARRFRVFIVSGVPRLDDRKPDVLIRFVTLVDTLYDHHARLAMSAAAPPDQLYHGEDHTMVFARTVSRLMEMQSRDYREARE